MLRVLLGFLKRDFLLHFSYKFSILSNVVTVLTFAGTFYYIGRLFGDFSVGPLKPFGGDYFSYVLVGIAISNFVGGSLGTLSIQLRQEQLMGTLEAIFSTPISAGLVLFAMNFWNFLLALLDLVIYIVAGVFVFGISFNQVDWLSFLLVLFLTVITFMGLGTVAACVTLIFKAGHSLAGNLNVVSDFAGGVYFPVSVLPWFLKGVAYLIPTTYAIAAANKSIYLHASPLEIQKELFILSLFAGGLSILGLYSFRLAIRKAKQYGNLTHY